MRGVCWGGKGGGTLIGGGEKLETERKGKVMIMHRYASDSLEMGRWQGGVGS